jgi:hypothetical protein
MDGKVLENMSSTRDEDVHSKLRRPVAHAYSLGTLIDYEPLVDSTSIVFMSQISRWLQMYAFDIMYEINLSFRPSTSS